MIDRRPLCSDTFENYKCPLEIPSFVGCLERERYWIFIILMMDFVIKIKKMYFAGDHERIFVAMDNKL